MVSARGKRRRVDTTSASVRTIANSSETSDGSSETTEADGGEDTTTTEAEPDPCTNDLQVVNGEAETATTVPDGPFEAVTMWSEGGPHPDNDIDEDQNLDLGFFTYEEPPDQQFGVSIPIDPDTPDGEHFLSFSLYNASGPIEAGQSFIAGVSPVGDRLACPIARIRR